MSDSDKGNTTTNNTADTKTAKPTALLAENAPVGAKPKVTKATTRKTAPKRTPAKNNVVDMHTDAAAESARAVKETATRAANKAKDTAEKLQEDSATTLMQGADTLTHWLNESMAISRDHAEACVEASNITAEYIGEISETVMNYANEAITENVELSKNVFQCRTASDVFELQRQIAQSNMDRFLEESGKITDILLDMTSKTSEPFNERLGNAAQRLNNAAK